MSTSHLTMAQSSLTFTPNLQTKTNTYYIRHVIPYTPERAISFSLALRLRHICSTNETFTLTTNELIDYLYKRGYNRYFLHGKYNELTISQGQFHTGQTRTCSLRYHLQHSPSFHLIHYSQTFSHPYFISPLLIDVVATSAIF